MSIPVRQIAKKFVSMTRSVTRLSQNMLRQGTPALKLSCKSCLATDHPHTISSIPSSAAIKSQLFRANLKENPRPPIPYTHEDFMSLDLPTMFTQTADGKRFLDKHKVDVSLAVRLGM